MGTPADRRPRLEHRHDETATFEQALQDYRAALERLEAFGLRVSGSSRLRSYERRLAALPTDPGIPIPLVLADQLLFDLREIDEVILIVGSFDGMPTPEERHRLSVMVGGHENPDRDGSGQARDAQFELFLRAALKRGGGEVILGSPDLLSVLEKGQVPMEAKRPTSQARLDDRLRGAVHQLERHGSPGLVALSLDHVIRPRGGYLGIRSADELGPAVDALMQDFVRGNLRRAARRVKGKPVAGILFVFRTPARAVDTNMSLIGSSFHFEHAVDPAGPLGWMVDAVTEVVARSKV